MKTKNNAEFPTANELANEPKMPEVIYVDKRQEHPNLRHCYHRQMDGTTIYHHDYKVQELKTSLEELVLALDVLKTFHRHSPVWLEFNITDRLTKASNLLK